MQLQQKTITTIIADEGKILRRRRDGLVMGDRITLGYNYYEAGILLREPHLEKPDDYDEIPDPALDPSLDPRHSSLVKSPTDHIARLRRMAALVEQAKAEINDLGLSAAEALQIPEWFPELGVDLLPGTALTAGTRFRHQGQLWRVLIDHDLLPLFAPGPDTAEYYRLVTPEDDLPEVEEASEEAEDGEVEEEPEGESDTEVETGEDSEVIFEIIPDTDTESEDTI